jgi:uncharacterized protein (DUF58 family)
MTPRGRAVIALGLLVYVVAWVFGSRALYPVSVGTIAAVALAVGWVRLSARRPNVRRRGPARDAFEGDDIRMELDVEATSLVPPPALVAIERAAKLGEHVIELDRGGHGRYRLQAVPRGRYRFEPVRIRIEDPFGLARAELAVGEDQALVVYPRLVELDRLFTEGGSHAQDGRRLLLRRPTGFELHSVREYQQGESLRNVHWRSTARRGALMIKELEDAPRDEVCVLLDGLPERFDVAVRAAGSILQAHVQRARRCLLVVNSAVREEQSATDWRRTLEVLAAAEPTATTPAFALLDGAGSPAARALELVVVTSRLDDALADRLVQRALSRRGVSLVHLGERDVRLLRLQSAGVAVALIGVGDDLAAALSAKETRVVA